jgi:four helix bundle protein
MKTTHKNLKIWQNSIQLVIEVYNLTRAFPKEELYGLSSQMRRAAISVPSNIAEDAARKNKTEYLQFLYISLGSLSELETQLIISEKIGYCEDVKMLAEVDLLRMQMLNLIKYMKTTQG